MKLEQAKQTRDKYLKIVGMTSPSTNMEIIDVTAEPLGIGNKFRIKYIELLREFETVFNDKLLQSFMADTYQVTAVLDYDGGLNNLTFHDISEYSFLIRVKSIYKPLRALETIQKYSLLNSVLSHSKKPFTVFEAQITKSITPFSSDTFIFALNKELASSKDIGGLWMPKIE